MWVVRDVQDAEAENGKERGFGALVYLDGPEKGDLQFGLVFTDADDRADILG